MTHVANKAGAVRCARAGIKLHQLSPRLDVSRWENTLHLAKSMESIAKSPHASALNHLGKTEITSLPRVIVSVSVCIFDLYMYKRSDNKHTINTHRVGVAVAPVIY